MLEHNGGFHSYQDKKGVRGGSPTLMVRLVNKFHYYNLL